MRKLALIATFVALTFAAMSCSKEESNGGSTNQTNQWEAEGTGTTVHLTDIDSTIVAFVSTYFPQTDIRKIEAEDDEYEVELLDGTEISFNLNFEWTHIDCEDATVYHAVPTELVPEQITAYVTANYPNQHIDKIEKKHDGGWEIELSNGIEIEFDSNFNVTHIDDK